VLAAAPCWDFRMVHLNANSRNERTLVCRIGGKGSDAERRASSLLES
jgi:hypothetical protein